MGSISYPPTLASHSPPRSAGPAFLFSHPHEFTELAEPPVIRKDSRRPLPASNRGQTILRSMQSRDLPPASHPKRLGGSSPQATARKQHELQDSECWRNFKSNLTKRTLTSVRPMPITPPMPLPTPAPLRARWTASSGSCSTTAHMLFPDDAKSVEQTLGQIGDLFDPATFKKLPFEQTGSLPLTSCVSDSLPSPRSIEAHSAISACRPKKVLDTSVGVSSDVVSPHGVDAKLPSDVQGMPRVHYLPKPSFGAGKRGMCSLPFGAGKDLLEVTSSVELSGRQNIVKLASWMASRAGPAPPLSIERQELPEQDSLRKLLVRAHEPGIHEPSVMQGLLNLQPDDVAPSFEPVSQGMHDLARMSASHCVEQGMLIEYMRRHYIGAVQLSQHLLRVAQDALMMYEQLREVTDEQLLRRFQESLGDALKMLGSERQVDLHGGDCGAASSEHPPDERPSRSLGNPNDDPQPNRGVPGSEILLTSAQSRSYMYAGLS